MSAQSPLISVVTVSYQAKDFISQCMESVLEQDFPDFEYIVIDGASTDGTAEIIRGFEARLAYWHSRQDRGVTEAFNRGLKESRGKWVLFLNSDDFLAAPDVLSRAADFLRDVPNADVVFGMVQRVSRDGRPSPLGKPFGGPFSWSAFMLRDTIPHPAAFTSRAYFERVGQFDESYRIAMDYELFLRGGPMLNARFVPVQISFMREGGVSRQNFRSVLDEWERAHIQSARTPLWKVRAMRALLVCRRFLGSAAESVTRQGLRQASR